MNPEFPTDPRQALEASLTALLLGELPDDQARFLRQAIATDPELARCFERLKKTTELIRETETGPIAEPVSPPVAPKLSEARRQQLLQCFKTVRPTEFLEPVRRKVSRVIPAAAAGVLMMLVATAVLPALSRSKSRSLARQVSNQSASLALLKNTSSPAELASGISSSARLRQGLRNHGEASGLDRREELTLNQQPLALTSSAPTPAPTAGPVQTTIVLPMENKPEALAFAVRPETEGNREWGLASQPQFSAGGTSVPAEHPPVSEATSFGLGGDGLGGGLAGNVRERIPVVGDVPLVGRLFRLESQVAKAPALPEKEGITPFSRLGQPDDLKLGETQQAAGAYYGGGAFGGYSSVSQLPLQAGQQVAPVAIQGVGDVPLLESGPWSQSAVTNAPRGAETSGQTTVEFLGYDDP
jgi:hypothetical protein